jgi:hypothetical protein
MQNILCYFLFCFKSSAYFFIQDGFKCFQAIKIAIQQSLNRMLKENKIIKILFCYLDPIISLSFIKKIIRLEIISSLP